MKNTRRPFAVLVPLAVATVALTGCSSSSDLSGTYYGESNLDSHSKGTVVVDGGTVTMTSWDCEAGEVVDSEEYVSVSLLNEDRTQVNWGEQGEHFNTGEHQTHGVVASDDKNVLQINKGTFYREGTEATDEARAAWAEYCGESAATDAARKANAKEKQAEAEAVTSQYEAAATKVIDAFILTGSVETGDTAVLEPLLQKNGITAAEMLENLAADEDAMMDLQAKSPEHLEALVVGLQVLAQQ
ncbi:hypothetical protein [Leucobacter luti]|uniref:hypothetical protein n=1 Tax=Leucobacter luti TaxID=340320 RepID=UPI001C68C4C7|nr:hypothetical protein [Leucobacter luti]QYM76175.1 hypothetical protein K1X41_01405 [Leucobacter luti]